MCNCQKDAPCFNAYEAMSRQTSKCQCENCTCENWVPVSWEVEGFERQLNEEFFPASMKGLTKN